MLALSLAASSLAACSVRTVQAVDPLDDLVGFWRLDDGGSSATARDSSGRANHGALVDVVPSMAWTAATGPEKTAFAPEGKGYFEVKPSASIDSITTQVSLVAWILLDGVVEGDFVTAISRQLGRGTGQLYHLSINAQQQPALFVTTPAEGQVVLFGKPIARGQWTHLAGTYDGSFARLYVDAEMVAVDEVTGSFAVETNPVILGGNANGERREVSERLPGLLNDVMLYRRALSQEEVARLFDGAVLP